MSYGWENNEPAPMEYFHGKLMDLFHEWRKFNHGSISGIDFNNLIVKAKVDTYVKYPKQVNADAIHKDEM